MKSTGGIRFITFTVLAATIISAKAEEIPTVSPDQKDVPAEGIFPREGAAPAAPSLAQVGTRLKPVAQNLIDGVGHFVVGLLGAINNINLANTIEGITLPPDDDTTPWYVVATTPTTAKPTPKPTRKATRPTTTPASTAKAQETTQGKFHYKVKPRKTTPSTVGADFQNLDSLELTGKRPKPQPEIKLNLTAAAVPQYQQQFQPGQPQFPGNQVYYPQYQQLPPGYNPQFPQYQQPQYQIIPGPGQQQPQYQQIPGQQQPQYQLIPGQQQAIPPQFYPNFGYPNYLPAVPAQVQEPSIKNPAHVAPVQNAALWASVTNLQPVQNVPAVQPTENEVSAVPIQNVTLVAQVQNMAPPVGEIQNLAPAAVSNPMHNIEILTQLRSNESEAAPLQNQNAAPIEQMQTMTIQNLEPVAPNQNAAPAAPPQDVALPATPIQGISQPDSIQNEASPAPVNSLAQALIQSISNAASIQNEASPAPVNKLAQALIQSLSHAAPIQILAQPAPGQNEVSGAVPVQNIAAAAPIPTSTVLTPVVNPEPAAPILNVAPVAPAQEIAPPTTVAPSTISNAFSQDLKTAAGQNDKINLTMQKAMEAPTSTKKPSKLATYHILRRRTTKKPVLPLGFVLRPANEKDPIRIKLKPVKARPVAVISETNKGGATDTGAGPDAGPEEGESPEPGEGPPPPTEETESEVEGAVTAEPGEETTDGDGAETEEKEETTERQEESENDADSDDSRAKAVKSK